MATVLEFNELGVGQQIGLQTTDRGVISGVAVDPAPIGGNPAIVFDSIQKASAKRLIDMSASELAGLNAGSVVWLETVKDWFQWDPLSTVTVTVANNTLYCNPTANGPEAAGRWVRKLIPWLGWVNQTTWLVGDADAANTDDENTGLPGSPLRTDEERQRRMGTTAPLLDDTAYHFRYAGDGFSPVFRQRLGRNTTPYIHGPTDRAGADVLASGTITAVTTQATGTNTAWAITVTFDGGRTDWMGLPGFRIRLTSGTHAGAISYLLVQDGVTPTKITTEDWLRPVGSFNVAPFVPPAIVDEGPAPGDTFVVETLRVMGTVVIGFQYSGSFSTAPVVVVESVDTSIATGVGGIVLDNPNVYLYVDGSKYNSYGDSPSFTHHSHSCVRNSLNDSGSFKQIFGGHFGTGNFFATANVDIGGNIGRITFQQGVTGKLQIVGGQRASYTMPQRLMFFWTAVASLIWFKSQAIYLATGQLVLFGSVDVNNVTLFLIEPGYSVAKSAGIFTGQPIDIVPLLFPVAIDSNPGGVGRLKAPAFDPATNAYVAPDRNLTFANIEATVAAGGFGSLVHDPLSAGAGFYRF